jgi:hypothetical protein
VVGGFVGFGYERQQIVLESISRYSVWATASIGAALLLAVYLWLRQSPHTHAVLLDVLMAAIPGAWFASNAALTWYNEHQDDAAPVHFVAKVESMYTSRHRNSTNYHFVVASWPDARGSRDVIVRQGEYSLATEGGCVGVIWHPGRLGDGWVSGYERANAESCGGNVE